MTLSFLTLKKTDDFMRLNSANSIKHKELVFVQVEFVLAVKNILNFDDHLRFISVTH